MWSFRAMPSVRAAARSCWATLCEGREGADLWQGTCTNDNPGYSNWVPPDTAEAVAMWSDRSCRAIPRRTAVRGCREAGLPPASTADAAVSWASPSRYDTGPPVRLASAATWHPYPSVHGLSAEASLPRWSCTSSTGTLCSLLSGLWARLLRPAGQRTVCLPVLRQPGTERPVGSPDEMDNDGENTDGRVEVSADSREYFNVNRVNTKKPGVWIDKKSWGRLWGRSASAGRRKQEAQLLQRYRATLVSLKSGLGGHWK